MLGRDYEAGAWHKGRLVALIKTRGRQGSENPAACILRPLAVPDAGSAGTGYFFFICSPQQISECGMPGGHGQPFSYTNSAPHFSQT
jgi:hypothetical protein